MICNSAKNGLIPQREYFDKDIANADNTDGYYIIEKDDFVYNPRKSAEAPYGPVSIYKYAEKGIVSPLYLCFRALHPINAEFFDFYFKSSAWHRYVYLAGDSGARHDRVSIRDDVFFAMPINLPSEAEQRKISSLLSSIEKRIKAQAALVENLKKYKRGLLDRVFNQNNGLYPSSWTEISIEDLFEPISDKNHPDETVLTIIQGQGTAPRDSIERRIAYDKSSVKTYKLTDVGDFILHLRSFEGGLEKTNQKGIVSPAYTVLRPKLIVETGFYYAYFRSYWFINNKLRDSVEGIRDGKSINMTSFWKIKIPLPSLEEQQRISHIFGLLDEKIQNSASYLVTLQALKRTLLKQMFI